MGVPKSARWCELLTLARATSVHSVQNLSGPSASIISQVQVKFESASGIDLGSSNLLKAIWGSPGLLLCILVFLRSLAVGGKAKLTLVYHLGHC